MILTLLGTNPYAFGRLASAMDELAGRHGWDVFMQTGHTPFAPRHCRHADFLPRERIVELVRACEVLVTQGGAGSIHEGLAAGRPVVAVPRRPELGESQDRQEDLVRALEAQGRVLAVHDIAALESAIAAARTFRAAPAPGNRIPALIRDYLGNLTP